MKTIDADALMMELADWWYSSFGMEETEESKAIRQVMDQVEKSIEKLSTVHPEPEWIPVRERLPDKIGMYTVTDHIGNVVRYAYTKTETSKEYWERCAVAWMPSPEPYKEGQRRKET